MVPFAVKTTEVSVHVHVAIYTCTTSVTCHGHNNYTIESHNYTRPPLFTPFTLLHVGRMTTATN